jgi:hypothetical protein
MWKAYELSPAGPVTAALLADVLERLQAVAFRAGVVSAG